MCVLRLWPRPHLHLAPSFYLFIYGRWELFASRPLVTPCEIHTTTYSTYTCLCAGVCVCVRACVPIVIVRAPPFVFLCHVRQRTEELPSTRTQLVLGLELATQLDPELAREMYKEKEREGDSERDRTNLFCAAQVRHISRQSAQAQLQSQCQS